MAVNGTLYSQGLLDTGLGFAVAGLIGILFGFFLEQAGFGSSRKLTGIFYFRDMAVLKVMFTAVVTALIGCQYLAALGWLVPSDLYLLDTYWGAQIVGGLIFGVGFVMGGWCPGTALVGLGSLKADALVFLGGAILGSVLFNGLYDVVEPLYAGGCAGPIVLSDTLHVSPPLLVVVMTLAAVVAFSGSTALEQAVAGAPPPEAAERRRRRKAAGLALVLALGTFFLPKPAASDRAASGEPAFAAAPGAAAGAAAQLDDVAAARDHVDALDLAAALVAGEPGWTVVDLRSAHEYARFHLRGSISIPLETLAAQAGRLPRDGRVVLYSNGTAHAAQAWIVLRRLGWTNALVLTDGLLGFWREALTPPSLAGTADEELSGALYAAFVARRDFFLGAPPAPAPALDAAAAAPAAPAAAATEAASPAGPRPSPLIEPGPERHLVSTDWLARQLLGERPRLLDVRAKSTDYTKSHIPGALYLNLENLRATIGGVPNMLVPAEDIARALGRLGLVETDRVIVYSDELRDATFVAMALERVGHRSFAVLHGGWNKWVAEGRPVASDIPAADPHPYAAVPESDTFTVGSAEVKASLGDGRTVILDVRPAEYFSGARSDEPRAGHIPGAKNREFKLDLVPGSALWQAETGLRRAYEELGVVTGTPVIVHCRTGHQASQTAFLLRHVLGYPYVKWYDGSWLEWSSRPELPIEK